MFTVLGPILAVIYGTIAADLIKGTSSDDQIRSGPKANPAFDTGGDTVGGGAGNDQIKLYGGNDKGSGGAGADSIDGGRGTNTLDGGDGADLIYGNTGNLINTHGQNTLTGGLGNDTIWGGGKFDAIDGGDGNDVLFGGPDGIPYAGGADQYDDIKGGPGNDSLYGGVGFDVLSGGDGNDLVDGGPGGNYSLGGGPGNDTIIGIETVSGLNGGPGIDSLTRTPGSASGTAFRFITYNGSNAYGSGTNTTTITAFQKGKDELKLGPIFYADQTPMTNPDTNGDGFVSTGDKGWAVTGTIKPILMFTGWNSTLKIIDVTNLPIADVDL